MADEKVLKIYSIEGSEDMTDLVRNLSELIALIAKATPAPWRENTFNHKHEIKADGNVIGFVRRLEDAQLAAFLVNHSADVVRMAEENALLSDPVFVHMNMLRGGLARPSIANIIHIYGADALRVALNGEMA